MEFNDWQDRRPEVDPDQLCVCGHTDAEHERDHKGRLICPDDEEA